MKATKLHLLATAADKARKANSAAYTKWSKDQTPENDSAWTRTKHEYHMASEKIPSPPQRAILEALEDARACAIRDVAVFCTELRANLKVPEDAMGDYDRGSLVALALVINRCEQMLKEGWPK